MTCPVCTQETTIHHKDDRNVYLSCGHTARENKRPGLIWKGFRDGVHITLELRELMPTGDMKTTDDWRKNKCPVCYNDIKPVSASYAQDKTRLHLECGHVIERSGDMSIESADKPAIISAEMHTPDNAPERGLPADVQVDKCFVCGIQGSYILTFLPKGIIKCNHGGTKWPQKQPITVV